MAAAAQYKVPSTPRVISPSPTPSERSGQDGYFGPVTRSATRAARQRMPASSPPPPTIDEDSSSSDLERRRPRARSRSVESRRRRMSGLITVNAKSGIPSAAASKPSRQKPKDLRVPNGTANGHLSPQMSNKDYWRTLSRSPSPLGLIPIHQEWRSFIHRHEIPRKLLHVSIGFLTLSLYHRGLQSSAIHPVLLSLLIPISLTDLIRHHSPSFNRLYIRVLGALMRESEVDGWNGVIWYLLGAWISLRFFPKDVGVMSVLLLSWCDTAASTFGRLWGRYTWRVRPGKSAAGSTAALVTGVGTAVLFWGYLAPLWGEEYDVGENAFMFQGRLTLPGPVRGWLGWTAADSSITGKIALGAMSLWAGVVAAASEAIDLFGWDDNLTIPALCGVGLWGCLKVFG